MKDLKYINLHCPHCGSNIFLNVYADNDYETFKEKYDCTCCGNNFNVKYDIVLGKLNISTDMNLVDE